MPRLRRIWKTLRGGENVEASLKEAEERWEVVDVDAIDSPEEKGQARKKWSGCPPSDSSHWSITGTPQANPQSASSFHSTTAARALDQEFLDDDAIDSTNN